MCRSLAGFFLSASAFMTLRGVSSIFFSGGGGLIFAEAEEPLAAALMLRGMTLLTSFFFLMTSKPGCRQRAARPVQVYCRVLG